MLNFSAVGVSASFNGSGTTTPKRASRFLITGVTGLIAPDGFRGNNNLLFPSDTPTLDSHGFSFTDVNGPDHFNVNIFDDDSGYFAYLRRRGQPYPGRSSNLSPACPHRSRCLNPPPSCSWLPGFSAQQRCDVKISLKAARGVHDENDPGAENLSTRFIT